jgi:7,8-dihydropterin-6-yl-methyl-4-(beta-D-ribofuranosyl)aminobenzene 5'-phosphate synthase
MNVCITVLVENTARGQGLLAEHGLSCWIEYDSKRVLYDTGQGQVLASNAYRLKIPLYEANAIVLSHGHYDHTGAIDYVLQQNPSIAVFAHPEVLRQRYSIHSDCAPKEISMAPEEQLLIENLPDTQLHWVWAPVQIASGTYLTGPIPRVHPLEDTGGPFFTDPDGRHPDPITDDMAMWIETERGLLILCGCCHSGLINTVTHIFNQSADRRIYGIIGGLHLKDASAERLAATTEALRRWNPEFIIPCHCTGEHAIDHFRKHLTTPVHTGYAGLNLQQEISL